MDPNTKQKAFRLLSNGMNVMSSRSGDRLGVATVVRIVPGNLDKRFKVRSLTYNTPLLTAWLNDTSYVQVFAQQLRNSDQSGNVALAISGSGFSPNVLRALETARGRCVEYG
jgi:D-sedoheptulose 7-phosphate isomerase